jgi:hypothetical protein
VFRSALLGKLQVLVTLVTNGTVDECSYGVLTSMTTEQMMLCTVHVCSFAKKNSRRAR